MPALGCLPGPSALDAPAQVSLHRKLKIGRFDQHFEELLPLDKTPVAFLCSEYGVVEHDARKSLGQFGLDGYVLHFVEIGGGVRLSFCAILLHVGSLEPERLRLRFSLPHNWTGPF